MCKKYIRFKINSDIIYYLSYVNKKNILLQHIWENDSIELLFLFFLKKNKCYKEAISNTQINI